ncbi:MAG: PKD domain-containing protein, partial [Bacteroidetes bacterium]|nr:PKD domain-containing protein [Bacteroidota bacterium]
TSANPVDKVTFDPSAAALGEDTVRYTYTNANGCTNSTRQRVIINPVTNINYTVQTGYLNPNLTWEICAEQNNPSLNNPAPSLIKLIGSPPASQGRSPETNFSASVGSGSSANKMNIIHSGLDYYIETKGLPADTFVIAYTYRNQYDAITTVRHPIIVHAAPRANISITNNCIASAINFDDATPVNPVEPVVSWRWDFGDGAQSSTKTTSHIYTLPNIYNVTLQVTTSFGCSDTTLVKVRVGAVPLPKFKASSICNNDSTRFTDLTTNPNNVSRITKFIWDFGDGKILSGDSATFGTSWNKGNVPVLPNPDSISGTYKNPFHKYRKFSTYTVKQTVLTNDGCNNSYQKTIFILPYSSISPKPSNSYTQDFESANHGWIAESLGQPLDSSWVWTVPNGKYINAGTKSWWTGLNGLNSAKGGTYNPLESSTVNGPCFNLTNLNRPMIALDYWVNTPKSNNDGAVLQYSTDGGSSWVNIGVPLQGRNWYSPSLIVSNPGNQPVGLGPYGWSGPNQKKWLRGSFGLDSIPKSKRKQVRIRIAFAGDVAKNIDDTYSGFAFDNVFVGEKTKNVLIEHFTNANVAISLDGDNYLNGLYDKQVLFRKDSSDFYDLQYHVSFPTPDAFDQGGGNDPSARALFYGIQQAPYSVMDGIQKGKFQLGVPRQITLVDIDSMALKLPLLSIANIDTTSQNAYTNHTISLKLNLVADAVISGPLMAQVALVEDPVVIASGANAGTYHNIVRKLLLGSEGVKTVTLNKGDAFTFAKSDIEIDAPIANSTNLHLVAFVQDFATKEILQSFRMQLKNKKGKLITAIDDPSQNITALEGVKLYPNPANGKFSFGLPGDFPSNCVWKISDQRGVDIISGDFSDAVNGVKTVDVSTISNGVYFVAIGSSASKLIYRKLVVLNSN